MTEQITTTTKEARSIEEDNDSVTERGTGYIVRLGILHFEAPKEYPGGDVKKAVLQMLLELKKAFQLEKEPEWSASSCSQSQESGMSLPSDTDLGVRKVWLRMTTFKGWEKERDP